MLEQPGLLGDEITYSCPENHRFIRLEEPSLTVRCLRTDEWSASTPFGCEGNFYFSIQLFVRTFLIIFHVNNGENVEEFALVNDCLFLQ